MGFNKEMENAVSNWIDGVLGRTVMTSGGREALDFKQKLDDGIILCELMNKIKPGAIPKYNKKPKMPFMKMENIGLMNDAMSGYGLKSEYLFVTKDLYEGANLNQVLIGLRSLGTEATKNGVKPAITI